ncbi:unnamed protein product, partial [Closterium sp. NIES-53]
VVTHYSSHATASLGRLLLPYLFPELSAFATVEDLVSHLRASDARYRAALSAEFLNRNLPPMYITLYFIVTRLSDSLRSVKDHFLSLDPTSLTVDLLEQHLLAAETSAVAVGAARGTPRMPFFEGCSPSPLAPSYASAAAVDVLTTEDVRAASASAKRRSSKGKGGRGGGGGSSGGSGGSGGGGSGGSGSSGSGGSGGGRTGARRGGSGGGQWQRDSFAPAASSGVAIFDLDYDALFSAMYALSASAKGVCYRCVPPDPAIAAATLGASESVLPCTAPAEALHTFTLDSGASRCFFRDKTTLTPLTAPVPVQLADLSGGPVVARSSTVLPCPAYRCPPRRDGHYHHSWGVESVRTDYRASSGSCVCSGVRVRSGSTPLLVSPPFAPDSSMAPPPGSPLPAMPSWHALPSLCLWSSQVSSSPPALACPALPSLRRGVAAHRSSLLLVSPDDAPLQTLHIDVWGPAHVSGQGREPYFLLVVDDYPWYTMVFPFYSKSQVIDVLIPWICAVRLQLRERFRANLLVLCQHSDRGGEFSSDLLRDFCRGEGILRSFTLPDSPLQNGIAERRTGLVMEVARTSMIHAADPHFLWSVAVRYAAHQLNLWPHVSFLETSPTLHWTGKVGDASMFRVWGSHAFVCDTSADKLSARAIPCVFLGFPPDTPGWQFYHPTSRHIFPSQDVTFDESVPLYRVSQVHPLPRTAPIEVAAASGAARGAASGGAASGGAEPGVAESEGAESGGAEPGGEELGGGEPTGAEPGGAEPEGVEPRGAESEGAESGGAEPQGVASSGGPAGASPRLSPQQVREWLVQRARLRRGATAGARGAGVTAGAGGTGGIAATGPGGARSRGTGIAGTGGVGVARAGDPTDPGAAGAGGSGAGSAGARGAGPGGTGARGAGAGGAGVGGTGEGGTGAGGTDAGGAGAGGAGAVDPGGISQLPLQQTSPLPAPSPYTEQSGGLTERREPASRPVSPVRTARCIPRSCPPPVPGTHAMALHPSFVPLCVPLPAPPGSSLPEVPDPESDRAHAASPTVSRLLATAVTDPSLESAATCALVAELLEFAVACHLDYATALVAESASASPSSIGGECALGTDVLEDRQEDFECLAAAVPRFASMLLAPEGDPDAPGIPTLRSYAEAITGPYSAQWQAAMDAGMASWKSTGTYVDEVPPPGANIVDGMYIFRASDNDRGLTSSPTPKMTTLRVLLHVAALRDYELHSLDFSTAFLQGSVHEEIWLRRPPGFTGSFPAGTQWSLRRPVYGLRQAPREWHNTLRTTLAALGFAPSTADLSLFLRTDTSLPPFYVRVYDDDLVFATADTEALTLVKSELQKRHTCTDLGELCSYLGLQITRDRAQRTITLTQSHMVHQVLQRFGLQFSSPQPTPLSTGHSLSAPLSDKSVEPSGPYPELVGCLMYLMTCTRPDLAYPLSLLARCVAHGRQRKVHWDAAKRVLRYLCSTSGMGLVLGGRGPVVLTSHADASWVDDSATQRSSQGYTFSLGSGCVSWRSTRSSSVLSSSCEAEIYVGAMATQKLCWLTYLLTDLGEQPRSPPQRGQLRLAYVATRANTADIFTKALQCGDHQRFSTVLGLPAAAPVMASPSVLTFDAEGRAVDFDVWLDDLQLFLQCDSKDDLSLFDLTSRASTAPAADAHSTVHSQWLARDAAARLAMRSHLASTERAHFSQYKSAKTLYNTVVARYSSPATATLSRLMLPYLFPNLAAFATVTDLITHLRTSDTRYRAALPAEFCAKNPPPMYITLYYLVT